MNKVFAGVFGVAAAVLAVFVVFQNRQIDELKMRLAELPESGTVVERVVVSENVPQAPKVVAAEQVKSSTPGVSEEAEAAFQEAVVSASSAKQAEKKGPDLVDLMKIVGAMMTNDAMKGMMRTQAEMQLEMQYGRLFKYLNLSPEKAAALKKLMADRQGSMMADGMSFLEGGFNKTHMERRGKEMKAKRDEFDRQIAELLGPEDYDVFKQYEDTAPERNTVEMLKHQLSAAGEPLSEDQERELVNRFHASRTNYPALRALSREDEMPDPEMFVGSGMTNVTAALNRQQEMQAHIARDVLSPAQFQQYERQAEQHRQMQQLGLQMAAQMFGGLTNPPLSAPPSVQVQSIVVP